MDKNENERELLNMNTSGSILLKETVVEKENNCLRMLKVSIILLCLIGFFFNSFMIFKQFVGSETVTSNKIQENSDLYLPSITLCGPSGFKSAVSKYSDLELENYLNNTVNLEDMLIHVRDIYNNHIEAELVKENVYKNSKIWKLTTTYSAYRGRCYTIEYRKKVFCK